MLCTKKEKRGAQTTQILSFVKKIDSLGFQMQI